MRRNPLLTLFFIGVLVFLYTPLFYLVFQTFLQNPHDLHSDFTVKWIVKFFESGSLWEPLMTSVLVGVCAASLSCVLGTLGAVGFFPMGQRLPGVYQSLILLPILLPEVITGLSLLLFFLLLRVDLGFCTIVIAHASFSASFVYFIMIEQLRKLDRYILDAAQDLGASPSEVFRRVTLPNIIPGLLGGWLLAFTLSFDDFLISFFTSGAGTTTLPLKIYSLMRLGISPEVNGFSFVMIALSTFLVVLLVSGKQSRKWILKG